MGAARMSLARPKWRFRPVAGEPIVSMVKRV